MGPYYYANIILPGDCLCQPMPKITARTAKGAIRQAKLAARKNGMKDGTTVCVFHFDQIFPGATPEDDYYGTAKNGRIYKKDMD